ncbi:hypothetical protein LCGC14_2145600, partial [marine sediment metagenome]
MKSILMNGESIRGILEGRKTQTRRVIKPQPPSDWGGTSERVALLIHCPHGQVGDRLWVRETFSSDIYHSSGNTLYRADGRDFYTEYGTDREHKIHWKPSIHMP